MKVKYKFSITIVKKRLLGGLVVFNRANVNNTVYKLKNGNFYVHPNNKVSIAVESREVLLDPSLFLDPWTSLTSKFLLLGVFDLLRHRSALLKIARTLLP